MLFNRKNLSDDTLLELYKKLLLPRMIEEKMLVLLRQGKISKWFSGMGQEAISVGATMALQQDEWIMPLHRNLGVFTSRNMPLHKLFKQWQGSKDGYSKGRERSFHFGNAAHHICGMISHLGPQLAIADGVALAHKLKSEQKVSLAFTGEGGTSEGDFHEALNVAAVWDLPVIFIIENNGYGLSTPVNEQYRCFSLVERARGYGMEGVRIDGNNVLEVYDTIKGVREYCIKNQKPYLIECMTFRMRGHEEASGVKYVPKHLFDLWEQKDPIQSFEKYLVTQGVLSTESVNDIRNEFKEHIEAELKIGYESAPVIADTAEEINDIYAKPLHGSNEISIIDNSTPAKTVNAGNRSDLRFIEAIKEGLFQSMQQESKLVLMGQDIAEYGGAFKITEGFVESFGNRESVTHPSAKALLLAPASVCRWKDLKR
jgi:2-oxoisovalerate dehydrogenase E1 component